MAAIYMTHPEHGAMHAISEYEATQLEARGWIRGPQPRLAIMPDEEPEERQEEIQVKRGPGRPRKYSVP